MSGSEIATDTATFDQAIESGDMVVAKFQTKTCVICRRIEPGLKHLVQGTGGALRMMDVDAQENAALSERYDIAGVPTLILFKDGQELTRCSGFQSASMLRQWMAPFIGD